MASNFRQISALLNEVNSQVQGRKTIAPVDAVEFASVGSTVLSYGYDPVINAITQVINRTIFSVRPYNRKFKGMENTESQWGDHIRKLTVADPKLENDDRYQYPVGYDATVTDNPTGNGKSVDQYALRKPTVLQTNFYGSNVFESGYTIFRDQLDTAFTGPDEFSRFMAMVSTNMSDLLEQSRESVARTLLASYIGGIISENNTTRVVKLLTEYNTTAGTTFTKAQIMSPANFGAFTQWLYGRVAAISDAMTERGSLYQTNITGYNINRHTPKEDQRVYLLAPFFAAVDARVMPGLYNTSGLKLVPTEAVNFWQNANSPDSINITSKYLAADGTLTTPDEAVEQSNIIGVIADREAMGYAITQNWANPTPFNARGGYTNIWLHETQKTYIDYTEKGVVLLLE